MKDQLSKLDTANLTSREIAQKLDRTVTAVRSYLDRYKIPYLKKFERNKPDIGNPGKDSFSWDLFKFDKEFGDIMFLP
jgi:hypothetical protein